MDNCTLKWVIIGVCILITLIGLYLIIRKEKNTPAKETDIIKDEYRSAGSVNSKIIGTILVLIGLGSAIYCSKTLQGCNTPRTESSANQIINSQNKVDSGIVQNSPGNTQQTAVTPSPNTTAPQSFYFYDDFSKGNINNWNIGENDSASRIIENNQLIIDDKRLSRTASVFRAFNIDLQQDFAVEVMATKISGDHRNGYGIVWGVSDKYNLHNFIIDDSRKNYEISNHINGNKIVIKPWTNCNAIKESEANKLTIKKHADSLYYYINNILVAEETLNGSSSTRFGMTVEPSYTGNERKVAFKYFKVTGTLVSATTTAQTNNLQSQHSAGTTPYNFYDDFSKGNINNWNLASDNDYYTAITDDQLIIDNRKIGKPSAVHKNFNIDIHKDFTIETMALKTIGDAENGYGIVWGLTGPHTFYIFVINNLTGNFCIDKHSVDTSISIENWTKTNALKQEGYNKLTIKKHDNFYGFYINDIMVFQSAFSAFSVFSRSETGMVVEPGIFTDQRKVSFKYFKVSGTLNN